MAAIVSKSVQDNDPPMLEIREVDGKVEIRIYSKPGPQGGRGVFKGGVIIQRKEEFLDMIVALWPENVAYQFNTEKKP